MGLFSAIFGINKLNADPAQQRLARALIDAVDNNRGSATAEIFSALHGHGWSLKEQGIGWYMRPRWRR